MFTIFAFVLKIFSDFQLILKTSIPQDAFKLIIKTILFELHKGGKRKAFNNQRRRLDRILYERFYRKNKSKEIYFKKFKILWLTIFQNLSP